MIVFFGWLAIVNWQPDTLLQEIIFFYYYNMIVANDDRFLSFGMHINVSN